MTIAPWGGSRAIYRIVVRDLLLMCRIGIYEHERLAPQRVRINVDLAVAETVAGANDDIANVYNYEDVIKGTKAIIAVQHIDLVETLAEEIAAHCLQDKRVEDVRVRVEKLDVYAEAESVGIEIVRRQSLPVPVTQAPQAVVRLGDSPYVRAWLSKLVDYPVVLVPELGPFADPLQAQTELSVAARRHLQWAAMAMWGRVLADWEPRLQPVTNLAELGAALSKGQAVLWLPDQIRACNPADLALDLAVEVKAPRLIAVGGAIPAGSPSGIVISAVAASDAAGFTL